VATFAGDETYQPVSDTQSFTLSAEETTLSYTGPTVILAGASGATLTAKMVEDGANDNDADGGSPAPVPSEHVTLALGSQTCSSTTSASGSVSCTIPSVTVPLGSESTGASFAGDGFYTASSASGTATVFAFPSQGAFVLGDATATAAGGNRVTWWSSGWWGLNSLSGGVAPAAFKGFARNIALPTTTPPAKCGSAWTTNTGDSPAPPATVPSYMGTVVSSRVSQAGSTASGNTTKIVVVKTNSGYRPDPADAGTGTIVATYC
jgi:hypothetical protein